MKRILSLFLAAILVFSFSSVAFAAKKGDVNGDGNVNSSDALSVLRYSVGLEKNISSVADVNGDGTINSTDALIILQISVGIINDSKYLAKFALEADVNGTTYDYSDIISVKKGDTISVTLSLSNNYYTGPTSAQIYYNSNIFDSAPSYKFNTSGRLYQSAGKTYCTFLDWSGLAQGVKDKSWPDYSEPQLTEFKENHKFLRITMTPNTQMAVEAEKDINENLITIEFKVSNSAKKGTTGQIIIPIESRRTKQFLNGNLMCAVHESADITSSSSVYLEDLGYDCTKAVLNFKVS